MREFTTAANELANPDAASAPMEFQIDKGPVCRAYRPKDGQLAVLMASTGKHSSNEEQIAGVINFFVAVLDDESQSYIISKLLDRKDPFGIDEVQEIMEWMVEEWSGRPTQPLSVSTPSQTSIGPSSTPPTHRATLSDSPLIGS